MIVGLLIGSLFVSGCWQPNPPTDSRTLRISQRNEPTDLDPATASLPDEFFIIRALSEGLVSPSPEGGTPVPAAAERWELSADQLTYTFHLRPTATWSNGEPVTAADFVASYQRVLTPATAAAKANLFFLVRGAEDFYRGDLTDFSAVGFRAIAPLTLAITLEYAAPQFLAHVASGPWIPVNPRVVIRFGTGWTQPGNFVGNGPFTLEAWQAHQHIVVKKRADYWDAANVHLDAIRFQAFDNGDAEERAFRAGQLDLTIAVPVSKIAGYQAQHPSPLRQIPLHETRFLTFNTQHAPLGDIRVRRALAQSIDRRALTTHVLSGGQHPAYQFVPEGLGHYRHGRALTENAAGARALLAEAGFPDGKDFPVLDLTGWGQTSVLEAIQAMWRTQLGITVRIGSRDAKVHLTDLQQGNYDIGFMTAIPDVADPGDLLKNFRTGAPDNYSRWSHANFDALIATAARTPDAEARLALLAEAEELLTDFCPVTPLYFNSKNFLQRSTVRDWREDALWTRFYQGTSLVTP